MTYGGSYMESKLMFTSDYMEGAHPEIIRKLCETNLVQTSGYGTDEYSESAKEKIRMCSDAPRAEVYLLTGGTQANIIVIDTLLKPWQGVMTASTGHINVHEAGGVEMHGHKVISLPAKEGKTSARNVEKCIRDYLDDENREHMVMPGMLYLSQPTEYGTLYSFDELKEISRICREYDVRLYVDGARLAYTLACPSNDVSLPDLAKLCDAFYIGGTKCGALFGEAVVFPNPDIVSHFITITKQHGALLAKGRILGIQFDTLFTDNLYFNIGKSAIAAADRIREGLQAKGYQLTFYTPTNQIFLTLNRKQIEELSKKVEMSYMEKISEDQIIMRIVTSWATTQEAVDKLLAAL